MKPRGLTGAFGGVAAWQPLESRDCVNGKGLERAARLGRFFFWFLLGCIALVLVQGYGAAAAEARAALVIGNGAYPFARLANPANDATDIATALRGSGFEVSLRTDVDQQAMQESIRWLGQKLKQTGGIGLFFFAGHAIQMNGENYLIPIIDGIRGEEDIKRKAVLAAEAVDAMSAGANKLNIVILDACRNNPLDGSVTRGLSRIDSNASQFVSFSTSPGSVALDGDGRNSPYTKHLKAAIGVADINIEQTFKLALKGVYQETHGLQTPWISSSFFGDFVFRQENPPARAKPSSAVVPQQPVFTKMPVLAGVYRVQGTNPNGSHYQGMASLWPVGRDYQFNWWIARQTLSGFGHLAGRMLVVNWGQKSPVIYSFGAGNRLDGEWADGSATERLELFALAGDGPMAAPSGRYRATGRNPDGSNYSGDVLITTLGSRLRLDWKVGTSNYQGTGTLAGNLLIVDWGSTTPVVYAITPDGSLRGLWAAGAGEEVLVPQ
jgi:Caspase domain